MCEPLVYVEMRVAKFAMSVKAEKSVMSDNSNVRSNERRRSEQKL